MATSSRAGGWRWADRDSWLDVDDWTSDVGLGPPDMDNLLDRARHQRRTDRSGSGGLRASRACGIATGGWAPRDCLTEAGPTPWLAHRGLVPDSAGGRSIGDRLIKAVGRCGRAAGVSPAVPGPALPTSPRSGSTGRGIIGEGAGRPSSPLTYPILASLTRNPCRIKRRLGNLWRFPGTSSRSHPQGGSRCARPAVPGCNATASGSSRPQSPREEDGDRRGSRDRSFRRPACEWASTTARSRLASPYLVPLPR
jgi:hypothetical protein